MLGKCYKQMCVRGKRLFVQKLQCYFTRMLSDDDCFDNLQTWQVGRPKKNVDNELDIYRAKYEHSLSRWNGFGFINLFVCLYLAHVKNSLCTHQEVKCQQRIIP